MNIEVPNGYRIERREDIGVITQEVCFDVIEVGYEGMTKGLTTASARYMRRHDEWLVFPGAMRSQQEPDEVRARACALFMAAAEAEARNAVTPREVKI